MRSLAMRDTAPDIRLGVERWADVADEAEEIGAQHFAEVERGLDPRRRYKLDKRLMQALDAQNMILIVTARVNGALAGYFTWQITLDVESEGLIIAQQGAWFVRPEYARFSFGRELLKLSISELKVRGVKCIFPHHRMEGRGNRLGLLFRRLGAVLTQETYMLWIGD
jgi:hypothetical protein